VIAVTVSVTPKDIQSGQHGSTCQCPIALAVERVMPGRIHVFDDGVYANRLFAKLPKHARAFIAAFDDQKPVKPLRFSLRFSEN
jgi:hypothetical protein